MTQHLPELNCDGVTCDEQTNNFFSFFKQKIRTVFWIKKKNWRRERVFVGWQLKVDWRIERLLLVYPPPMAVRKKEGDGLQKS